MSERPALPVKRAMRFFDPETEPQKFGHRWGKINSYDLPEKLFLAGTQRETYLLPSSSIGGLSFPANCNSALPSGEASDLCDQAPVFPRWLALTWPKPVSPVPMAGLWTALASVQSKNLRIPMNKGFTGIWTDRKAPAEK